MTFTETLDPTTDSKIIIKLFKNVKNVPEIRQKVMNGSLQCCVVKPSLIIHPFQITVAANKAVSAEKIKTKSIYSEILFNLSISKNITQSLQTFGIHDNETEVLVAVIVKGNEDVDSIFKEFDGEEVGMECLKEFTNENSICKVYKINDVERKQLKLLESVVTRIGVKDCLL